MKTKLVLVIIFALTMNFAYAALPSVNLSSQLDPESIFSLNAGGMPNESCMTLSLKGVGERELVPIEVVLAIDSSGSMKDNDPQNNRIKAAENFLKMINSSKDKSGLVSWDNEIDFSVPLTDDIPEVISRLKDINSEGSTNLDKGLQAAIDLRTDKSSARKVILFLSDGVGPYTPSRIPGSQVDRAIDENITIYSIGLNVKGSEAEAFLKDMAMATGGKYYDAPDSRSLEDIYGEIGKVLINVAGTNVKVKYSVPAELEISKYSIEPDERTNESNMSVMEWYIETISIGDVWNVSFNVSSSNSGVFKLGSTSSGVNYTKHDGKIGKEVFDEKNLKINGAVGIIPAGYEANSGVYVLANTSSLDFNRLYDIVNVMYDVVEYDNNHIIWSLTDTSDWAYAFADSKIFITSKSGMSLSKKDNYENELVNVIGLLNRAGSDISVDPQEYPITEATYYSKDAGIYHKIEYTGRDYDMFLTVPNCSVEEGRLTMIFYIINWGTSGFDRLNGFLIGDSHVFRQHDPGQVDITKHIPGRGEYPVYLRDEAKEQYLRDTTVVIEAITTPIPPGKEFVLHNKDFSVMVYESNPLSLDLKALQDDITKHATLMTDFKTEDGKIVLWAEIKNIGFLPIDPDIRLNVSRFEQGNQKHEPIYDHTLENIGLINPAESKSLKLELPIAEIGNYTARVWLNEDNIELSNVVKGFDL